MSKIGIHQLSWHIGAEYQVSRCGGCAWLSAGGEAAVAGHGAQSRQSGNVCAIGARGGATSATISSMVRGSWMKRGLRGATMAHVFLDRHLVLRPARVDRPERLGQHLAG